MIRGLEEFGEGPSIVAVHFEIERDLLLRQIAEVHRIELLFEASVRDRRHHEIARLIVKFMEQLDDPAEGRFVGRRDVAIPSVFRRSRGQTVVADAVDGFAGLGIFRAMRSAFERVEHLFDQIVDKEQFQFDGRIVDRNRQVVRDIIAERADGGVVVRANPFPDEIRKAIDEDLRARFFGIAEEQLFPVAFAQTIFRRSEPSGERRLDRRREHNRRRRAMTFERVEKLARESEIPLAKLLRVLRTVDAREIKDKIRFRRHFVEFLERVVDVIFEDFVDDEIRSRSILTVADILEVFDEVASDESGGARD